MSQGATHFVRHVCVCRILSADPSFIQCLESECFGGSSSSFSIINIIPLEKCYRLNSLVFPKVELKQDSERNEKRVVGRVLYGDL